MSEETSEEHFTDLMQQAGVITQQKPATEADYKVLGQPPLQRVWLDTHKSCTVLHPFDSTSSHPNQAPDCILLDRELLRTHGHSARAYPLRHLAYLELKRKNSFALNAHNGESSRHQYLERRPFLI